MDQILSLDTRPPFTDREICILFLENVCKVYKKKGQNFDTLNILPTVGSHSIYNRKEYEYERKLIDKLTPNISKLAEKWHWIHFGLIEIPKCKNCRKDLRYRRASLGYGNFCSIICRNTHKQTIDSWVERNKKIYGDVFHPHVRDKLRKSLEEMKKDGFKERGKKSRETCIKKYGVSHIMKSDLGKKLCKEGFIEKYGVDHYMKDPETKKKFYEKQVEKYGISVVGGPRANVYRHDKVKDLYYQGSYEKLFIDQWIKNHSYTSIVRGPNIPYHFENKDHIYMVDFKVEENGKNRLVEIKGSHEFFIVSLFSGVFSTKLNAMLKYSLENHYSNPVLILDKDPYEISSTEIIYKLEIDMKERFKNKVFHIDSL